LLADVLTHGGLRRSADGFAEVAILPQAVAPEPFFKLRELLPDHFAGAAFEVLHGGRDRYLRWQLQEHVHVIREDLQFMKVPLVHLRTLKPQLCETAAELGVEHFTAVLGDEDDVVEVAVHGVGTVPEARFFSHACMLGAMAAEDTLLIPALKRGACARDGGQWWEWE
jgi:hypothetical protein